MTAEEILEKNLHKNGCYNTVIVQQEVYQSVIDAINEALEKRVLIDNRDIESLKEMIESTEDTNETYCTTRETLNVLAVKKLLKKIEL